MPLCPSRPDGPPVRYDADLLSPAFHQDRRAAVLDALPDGAVAIFFSAPLHNRENDVNFEYHQASDLYYLTGMHEQASVLLLASGGIEIDGGKTREVLMASPRNPMSETWLGRQFGVERAQGTLGLEKVVSNERFEEVVAALAGREGTRFYHLPLPEGVDRNSSLGQQLALFKEHVNPLEIEGSVMVQRIVDAVLATNRPQVFAQIQPYIKNRFNVDELDGSPL